MLLLWAVLPRGAARPRLGRQHPLRPLHRTPGAAILTRTEAARGLTARATRQKPEADGEAREICAVPPRPAGLTMAQETRLATSAPPGSQALLDTLLQNLYDFGECRASEPTWRANLRTPDLAGLSFQAKVSCSSSTPRLLQPGSDNGSCTLPSPTTGVCESFYESDVPTRS